MPTFYSFTATKDANLWKKKIKKWSYLETQYPGTPCYREITCQERSTRSVPMALQMGQISCHCVSLLPHAPQIKGISVNFSCSIACLHTSKASFSFFCRMRRSALRSPKEGCPHTSFGRETRTFSATSVLSVSRQSRAYKKAVSGFWGLPDKSFHSASAFRPAFCLP